MGGGAHLRVDLPQPSNGEGLREVVYHRGVVRLRGDDAAYGEAVGPCVGVSRQSLETVWKIKTGPILKSHERADRDQQALLNYLVLPEITFNEPSCYFPDSFSRNCLINSQRASQWCV